MQRALTLSERVQPGLPLICGNAFIQPSERLHLPNYTLSQVKL